MNKETKKQVITEILTDLFKTCIKDNLDYPTDFEVILVSIFFEPEHLKHILQKKGVDRFVINTKANTTSVPKFKKGLDHILSDK
jgi:hypothetical protein